MQQLQAEAEENHREAGHVLWHALKNFVEDASQRAKQEAVKVQLAQAIRVDQGIAERHASPQRRRAVGLSDVCSDSDSGSVASYQTFKIQNDDIEIDALCQQLTTKATLVGVIQGSLVLLLGGVVKKILEEILTKAEWRTTAVAGADDSELLEFEYTIKEEDLDATAADETKGLRKPFISSDLHV